MKALKILIILIVMFSGLVLYLGCQEWFVVRTQEIAFNTTNKELEIRVSTDKKEYSKGEVVYMAVSISNRSDAPQTLEFRSSCRYDFIILKDDKEIWRWTNGKAFAQAITSITLSPGEQRNFTQTWKAVQEGLYTLIGIITSNPLYGAKTSFMVKL